MKTILVTVLACVVGQFSFSQLKPIEHKKLCLEGDVGRLMDIHVSNNLVIAKVGFGERIDALNYQTGKTEWSIKNKHNSGYGIFQYGEHFAFSCNVNMFDEKLKKAIPREWLFIANTTTGQKIDSVLLKYSVVSLSDAYTPPSLPAIIQGNDVKMKAVILNAKTGEIVHTFFTEHKEGSAFVVPTIIQSNKGNNWVATGTSNGTKGVYIHDYSTGALLKHLPGKGDVTGIAFSEDNSKLVYLQNGTLYVIDTKTWSKIKEIPTAIASGHMALHPDGENVVITGFGSQCKVTFVHLPSEKISSTELVLRGGRPFFSKDGNHLLIPSEGIQCKVNPTKMPYLTLMTFAKSAITSTTANATTISSNAAVSGIELGSRVFSRYSGKFYSATILAINGSDYTVEYDDNFIEIKKLSDLKPLTPIKAGDKIQCRNSTGNFVDAVVIEVKNQIVKVKHVNGAIEWVSIRQTMQVE
jgi:hypothetical protein